MKANSDRNQQPNKTSQLATDQSVREQDAPVRNSKVGLIVSIILGFVVAALIATTAVWSFIYHNPNKVISDATNKLFNAENVTVEGTIRYETNKRDADLQALLVTFDTASTNLPTAANVQVRAVLAGQDDTVALDVGSVMMSDGVIYLQASGMVDTLEKLGVDESDIDWIYETIEVIDNEWWRFDIAEATAALELSSKDREQVDGLYACIAEELDNDIRGEIGSLYLNNDFITVAKTEEARFATGTTFGTSYEGTDYYSLGFDYSKMAGFVNGLASIRTMQRIYSCVQEYQPGSDFNASYFNEVTARELQDFLENRNETDVFFEISKWGHELKHVVANVTRADVNLTADLHFIYNNGVKITAPDDYRPLTEHVDEITEAISELLWGDHRNVLDDIKNRILSGLGELWDF